MPKIKKPRKKDIAKYDMYKNIKNSPSETDGLDDNDNDNEETGENEENEENEENNEELTRDEHREKESNIINQTGMIVTKNGDIAINSLTIIGQIVIIDNEIIYQKNLA